MKNIDLNSFVGRDINILLKYADDLYRKDLEGKIHAHKIYSVILDKIPNIQRNQTL